MAAATADLGRDTDAKCRNVPPHAEQPQKRQRPRKVDLSQDDHVNMFRAVSSLTLRVTGEPEI